MASTLAIFSGCAQAPNAGHGDVRDAVFGRRHQEILPRTAEDSVLALAREVTVLEDELRRDGTITIKQPDVWGEGNMVHYIQEHDRLLSKTVTEFKETVQAYVARSDQSELRGTSAVAQGLGDSAPPNTPTANLIDIKSDEAFAALKQAFGAQPSATGGKVGVEPTELERQHSTFIHVNQALRRRNSGDDNSRTAGYGLYKFRIPVSVLPGRETSQGWSGVVNLRARLEVDAANLRFTFPKLAIADIVEQLTPVIEAQWNAAIVLDADVIRAAAKEQIEALKRELDRCPCPEKFQTTIGEVRFALETATTDDLSSGALTLLSSKLEKATKVVADRSDEGEAWLATLVPAKHAVESALRVAQDNERSPDARIRAVGSPDTSLARGEFQGKASIDALRAAAKSHFKVLRGEGFQPATMELRSFLFAYLGQVQNIIEKRDLYREQITLLDGAVLALARGQSLDADLRKGESGFRGAWIAAFKASDAAADPNVPPVSWLLAIQSAMLDQNLKKILGEIRLRSGVSGDSEGLEQVVRFYAPQIAPQESLQLWQRIIAEEFPLYVFTLDPQVEEQNAFDAFSRRRELQVALAYALASGKMNASRSLSFSRQLALDQETIALNRTIVGFNHGRDTFGWYFNPRIQSPPVESSNVGALARMVWSTGPTDHYDFKHRRLEPGIRECEVMLVMPSFVNQVAFDVTSNWESIPRPGKSKRSYEEMVAQGGRLYRVQCQLRELCDEDCFRPGDAARLMSRIEQLDQMLGMQTHQVRVPYEYEQTGTDLFDKGDVHLRPVIHNFYGLRFVEAGPASEAHFFVAGKNFHPALTHVILGGSESHNVAGATEVEVISREVLKVKITKLNAALSASNLYDLRIATPAGVSNVVEIPSKSAPKVTKASSDFDWSDTPAYTARFEMQGPLVKLLIEGIGPQDVLTIVNNSKLPLDRKVNGRLLLRLVAKAPNTADVPLAIEIADFPAQNLGNGTFEVQLGGSNGLERKIVESVTHPDLGVKPTQEVTEIVGTAWIKFDAWPFVKFDTPLKISILPNRLTPTTP